MDNAHRIWQEMDIVVLFGPEPAKFGSCCQMTMLPITVICINQTPTVRAAKNGKENDVPN